MKLRNYLLLSLVAFSSLLTAQTENSKFAIGLFGGLNEYNGDLGNGLFKFNPINPLGALSLSTYVSPSFNLGVQGSYGKYSYSGSYLEPFLNTSQNVSFSGNKYDAFMFLEYKLNNGYILSKDSRFAPFLTAGIGLAGYTENNNDGKIQPFPMDLITPVGAGLKFQFNDHFALQYKYLYSFTNHDEHDLTRIVGTNDGFGEHLLGLVISLGGTAKDSDGDGVKDSKDLCPNTPAGVKVDANGCPLDTDGDGIADYQDECPTVAGLQALKGCPDADGDGVTDSKDLCPNTPAGVNVDANGCPLDSDGDGIADYLDKCPTVAGTVENNGCPEEAKALVDSLEGIQFEFDSDAIKTESYPILNAAVETLKAHPEYNLDIAGHTDSIGTENYNQDLSVRRANSVVKYLTEKGIEASRLKPEGFGETKPISDNETVEGRAKNRRVEFKVLF
ncbi:MAG: OmpA family protein [Paludibacteraceae bacterium]